MEPIATVLSAMPRGFFHRAFIITIPGGKD